MFKLQRTFQNPAQSQSGFAEPGAGAQIRGEPSYNGLAAEPVDIAPERPTKGVFGWLFPASPRSLQAGQPEPLGAMQHRPPGDMDAFAPINGMVEYNWTPEYSRGAAAFVPNTGKVLTNPIGAGVVALQRSQASYGPSGEYVNGVIFFTSQSVPTSVGLSSLITPEQIEALVGNMNVQAMVRVG